MKHKYYLGLDQGTTGVTALLANEKLTPVATGYCPVKRQYPAPGLVEHDAEEILAAVKAAAATVLQKAGADADDIIAVGLDHEGESALLFDGQTGKPLSPVIVWQDRRTAGIAEALKAEKGAEIHTVTGLFPDAYFSATKWQWLIEHTGGAAELARAGRLFAANLDGFLLYRLTGGRTFATDASTASRTLLCNMRTGVWDQDMIALFGLAGARLPDIRDSAAFFGHTDPGAFLGISAPVTGLMVDQQAALFGQKCLSAGMVKTTYGTGCFMLMNTGDAPVISGNGLVTTTAWQIGGRRTFALDGGVYTAGAAIDWLRDSLGVISSPAEIGPLASSVPDTGGVVFVPAFNGLGAPRWDSYAAGLLIGIDGGTTRAHIARAAEEAIAYQVADLAAAMQADAGRPFSLMRCDGGAANDAFLMQFQADVAGLPVEVPACTESTALGAAAMAAVGHGALTPVEWAALDLPCRRFEPRMGEAQRQTLTARWHRAVERALAWREES